MTATQVFRGWRDRVDSGRMTKTQCQQWARVIVSLCEIHHTRVRTNLTYEEATILRDQMVARGGVLLTDGHTAQGLAWLERYAAKRFPNLPADWRDRFDCFAYMGEGVDVGRGGWPIYLPVWRIILQDGETWDYAATAWQSPYQEDFAYRVSGVTR